MSRIYKTSFSLKEDTRALLTKLQGELQVKESKNITKSEVIRRALTSFEKTLKQERTSKNA